MDVVRNEGDGFCILSFGMVVILPGRRRRYYLQLALHRQWRTYSQLLITKEYMSRMFSDLGITADGVYPANHFDLMGDVGFSGCALLIPFSVHDLA